MRGESSIQTFAPFFTHVFFSRRMRYEIHLFTWLHVLWHAMNINSDNLMNIVNHSTKNKEPKMFTQAAWVWRRLNLLHAHLHLIFIIWRFKWKNTFKPDFLKVHLQIDSVHFAWPICKKTLFLRNRTGTFFRFPCYLKWKICNQWRIQVT